MHVTTRNSTRKMLEEELSTWFANARDRGQGGRKPVEKRLSDAAELAEDE